MADISVLEDKTLLLLRAKRDLAAQEQQLYGKRVAIAEKRAEIKRLENDLVHNEQLVNKNRDDVARLTAEIAAEESQQG